jgi:glycosyltransferase involved in cell wall biosynthesis
MASTPLVFDSDPSGHRGRGVALLARIVDGQPLIASPKEAFSSLIRHRGPLLWQTADYALAWFLSTAIVRAVLGRRTVGLCYRHDAGSGLPLRSRARRLILSALSVLPPVEIVRVFPPLSGKRSGRWIYDPEWWDLREMPIPHEEVSLRDADPIVLFIGNIDRLKGIDFFIETAERARLEAARFSFLIVGSADRLNDDRRARFAHAGGEVVDSYPSDAQFLGYIARADFLWCCYHPDYDQSSGIFGRSLQLGIPALVREGSLLDRYGGQFGNRIAVSYGDTKGVLAALAKGIEMPNLDEKIDAMRSQAVFELHKACLGEAPATEVRGE